MRSLRLPLGLLLGLGLAAQVCTAAGVTGEDGGQDPRLSPVQPPPAGDFKGNLHRVQVPFGKHPAYQWMTPTFGSQLGDLPYRLTQSPDQLSWREQSIDPGIVRWADPSIDPGIVRWADPSIDPGIARMRLAPLAEAPGPTAPQAFVVPVWK